MDYETIVVEREGALMTVRFNRPDKRNAINRQMHAELQDLCHLLTDDTGTRVVIFTGAGRGFSSGADTSEWTESQSADELAVRHISGVGSRTSTAIEYLGQITIAAVHACSRSAATCASRGRRRGSRSRRSSSVCLWAGTRSPAWPARSATPAR